MNLPLAAGRRLPVDDGGVGGLPVVFIHSLGGSPAHWRFQLEHLRPQRHSLALTLRGHTGAPVPRDHDYSIPALAADVARTVDALKLEYFALVGHSAGAHVALAYAAAFPARVAGLLLADPAGDARLVPKDQFNALLKAFESDAYDQAVVDYYRPLLVGSKPSVARRVLDDVRATPKATIVGVFRAMLRFDPVAALADYRGPMLAVDTYFNEQPFSLPRLYPALRSTRLGDTGHWLQLDKPAQFNEILDGWLSRLGPGEPARRIPAQPSTRARA
jgi:pimeloyl-ACP methyl ester carboxylesterase